MRINLLTMALTSILLQGLSFCKTAAPASCIDESKISDGPCTFEYAPVCGCDGKTYSNVCFAQRSGVLRWEQGPCQDNN